MSVSCRKPSSIMKSRSEEHTSELQSLRHLVCRLLLEKNKKQTGRSPMALVAWPNASRCAPAARTAALPSATPASHSSPHALLDASSVFFFFLSPRPPATPLLPPFPPPSGP